MSTRRGFLAFLGGSAVTGLVAHRASAASPTLILPPGLITDAADFAPLERGVPTAWPGLNAYLSLGNSPGDAIIDIKRGMSQSQFAVWLEYGLTVANVDCTVSHRRAEARPLGRVVTV
jgi:hypothetical protein